MKIGAMAPRSLLLNISAWAHGSGYSTRFAREEFRATRVREIKYAQKKFIRIRLHP